jgi:hypothetical protein
MITQILFFIYVGFLYSEVIRTISLERGGPAESIESPCFLTPQVQKRTWVNRPSRLQTAVSLTG